MEPESSLPHSQVPVTCPYPEPAWSSPYPHIQIPEYHLNIILPSTPVSSKWSLSLRFLHQNPVYASTVPIRATCLAHLILLDFITRKIFGKEYRSLSSSLYSFPLSLVSHPSWAQIFSSALYSSTPSAYDPPSMWVTKCHAHTKQQAILYAIYLDLYILVNKLEENRFCNEW